ncbi:MAG: CBS domain-containing protein [Methylobacter sp.]|uniref:CBS domain-containing protein n=1 Tax=Methylobacter sp. TaxID=2051955 RepID=UPI00272FB224|nr:CBS domain-containing protein [Methylobacter sp.]MDP1666819.1 CBS domain-containing protein [Methylobacter sp.]MDP1970226.1 CBS domain-containing protein [Methylobacter sp.]
MDKPISSLMDKHVTTVDFNDTIFKVEEIMNSRKLSFVVVIDSNGSCFGVISYPDILHFHVKNRNPKIERAWELCTHKVIEVSSDTSSRETAKLMIKNKIHHIVITENESIVGIVSSNDFVTEYLKQNP